MAEGSKKTMVEERAWMYEPIISMTGELNSRFFHGVQSFLEFAFTDAKKNGLGTKCPCKKCKNKHYRHKYTIGSHLLNNGFIENYYEWDAHGEKIEINPFVYRGYQFDKSSSSNNVPAIGNGSIAQNQGDGAQPPTPGGQTLKAKDSEKMSQQLDRRDGHDKFAATHSIGLNTGEPEDTHKRESASAFNQRMDEKYEGDPNRPPMYYGESAEITRESWERGCYNGLTIQPYHPPEQTKLLFELAAQVFMLQREVSQLKQDRAEDRREWNAKLSRMWHSLVANKCVDVPQQFTSTPSYVPRPDVNLPMGLVSDTHLEQQQQQNH